MKHHGPSRLAIFLGCLLAATLLPTCLSAQLPGTLFGQVVDENQNPVADVTLTLTNPDKPEFKQDATTDKRGRYKLFVTNAVPTYRLSLNKDGYQPVNLNGVKVAVRQETRRNFTLKTAAAAAASGEIAPADDNPAADTYNKGVSAFNADDLDSAEMAFREALELDPALTVAHSALARLYLKREDYRGALAAAEAAIAAGVEATSMSQVLYSAYTALGDTEKAQAALLVLQAADPEKASRNLFNEGAELYNQGKMAEARVTLEKVVELDPKHAKGHYLLGLVYINEGANEKAKIHLTKFLELAPNDPDAATAKEMLSYLSN